MKLPAESSSSWVHISFAGFACASLQAWSEFTALPQGDRAFLADLSTTLRVPTDALLKEARETEEQQFFIRPAAQARQNAWLTLLKRTTKEALALVTIRIGNSSPDHPQVRQFLPRLLATITGKKIAERSPAAEQAAGRLEGLEGHFPEKAELAQRLRAIADGAKHAIAGNEAARGSWGKERSEEVVAKGRLRLELEKTHRLLGARFPGQKDFVESFFLRGSKPSEGSDDDEDGGEGEDEG
ncbi:MAG TPA: hypothetical protein VLS89_12335 [Candidatus Nanopelagicales bacterium]|nr:hypothetical protein [Candidatus Nanopelagicales bacterium]